MTNSEILMEARRKLEAPESWVQIKPPRERFGASTENPYSLDGATCSAIMDDNPEVDPHEISAHPCFEILEKSTEAYLANKFGRDFVKPYSFNDLSEIEHRDVITVLNIAIELAKSCEA